MNPKDLLPTLSGFFNLDPKLLALLGLVVPLVIVGGPKVYQFLRERLKTAKRAGPNVDAGGDRPGEPDLSARELLSGWRRFLQRLPRRYQRSILNFEHFLVMGNAAAGKSRLIDKQSDWLFQMKQVARDAPVDPTMPFYMGSGAVIAELPARYLEDSSDRCRQALDVLWRRLYKQRAPTVVVAVDVNWALAATRDELTVLAHNVRLKVNHLSTIRGRAIEVRVALTHGDTLEGFTESAKFWGLEGIANRIPLVADGSVGPSLRSWIIETQQQLPRALVALSASEYRKVLSFVRKAPEVLTPLEHLLDVLYVKDTVSMAPLRGGVYFCSDTSGSLSPVSQANESGPGPDPAHRQLIALTVGASACVTYFGLAYSAQYEAWKPAQQAMSTYQVSLEKGPTHVGSTEELTARRAINRFTVEHRGLLARFPGFLDTAREGMKAKLTDELREKVLIPTLREMALKGIEDINGNTLRWRRAIYCLGVIHSDSADRLQIRDTDNILLYSAMTSLDSEVIEDYIANSDTAYAEPIAFELQTEINPEDVAETWLSFPETIERILADNLLTEDELKKLQTESVHLRKALARFKYDETTLRILSSLDNAANTQSLDGVRRHVRLNDEYAKRFSYVKGVAESNNIHKTFEVIEQVLHLVDSTKFRQLTLGSAQGTLKALIDDLTLLKEAPATLGMKTETLRFELASRPISIDVRRWRDVLNHSRADAAVKHFIDKASSQPSIFFTPAVENGLPDVVWNAAGTEATIFVGRARLRGRYTAAGFDKGVKRPLQKLNKLLAHFQLDSATQTALASTLKSATTQYAFDYNAEAEQFLRTFRVNTPTAESLRVALGQIAAEKSSFSEFLNLLDENTDLQLELIDADDEAVEAEADKAEKVKANADKPAVTVAPAADSAEAKTKTVADVGKPDEAVAPPPPPPPFVLAELLNPMTQSLAGFEPWHLAVGAKRGGAELTKYREIANQLLTDLSAAEDAAAPAPKGGKDAEQTDPALEAELTATGRASLAALRADAGAYYAMAKNWAIGAGLTQVQRQPFLAPFAQVSQIGDRDIGDVVRRVWKSEMRPLVREVGGRFPFNRSAEKFVDPEELTEYFHPIDGKFFQLFRSYLEPVSSFGDGQPFRPLSSAHAFNLPPDLYPTVNAVAALSARLWDEKGDPRPLEIKVSTVPFVTQPNSTLVPTVVLLRVGKTSIFNFNQRPDTATLPFDWTQDDDAQLALHVTDVQSGETTFPAALAAPGKYWRFFRLLRAAKAHHTEADGSEVYEWERPTQDGGKQRARVRLRFEEDPWQLLGIANPDPAQRPKE